MNWKRRHSSERPSACPARLIPAVALLLVSSSGAIAQFAGEDGFLPPQAEAGAAANGLRGRMDTTGLPDLGGEDSPLVVRDRRAETPPGGLAATGGENETRTVNSFLATTTAGAENDPAIIGGRDGTLAADGATDPTASEVLGPYDPLGLRVGTVRVYPAVETGLEFTDNVLETERNRKSDIGYTVAPELRVETDWSRHAATLRLSSKHVFYDRQTTEDTSEIDVEGTARIDVTRRTRVDLKGGYNFGQEARSSLEVPDTASSEPDQTTWTASAGVTHRFNRLVATARGDLEVLEYGPVEISGGGNESSADRDYYEAGATLRLGYEHTPAIQPFVEGTYSVREHRKRVDRNGLRRDSDGVEAVAGVAVNLSPILQGEFSAGYGYRDFDDPSLDNLGGFIANGSITWSPTRLTKLTGSVQTEIEETNESGSPGALSRTAQLAIEHALRQNITANAGLSYNHTRYRGISTVEETYGATLGLEYLMNRNIVVRAGYAYEQQESNVGNSDFVNNTLTLGVRVQQ